MTHNYLIDAEVLEDYKSSNDSLELDIFIEGLSLAVEYQGEQHYKPIYGMSGDFAAQKIRDKEKQEVCKQVSHQWVISQTEQNYVNRSSILVGQN